MHEPLKAIVLPVDETKQYPYLTTLRDRRDNVTVMVWGWHAGRQSMRMAAPARIIEDEQRLLPFLFWPIGQEDTTGQERQVTHAAICGQVVHVEELEAKQELRRWLERKRIECFATSEKNWPLDDCKSVYVVTGTEMLDLGVPLSQLTLVSEGRPLNPNKQRGYSIVFLPDRLHEWYERACRTWNKICDELPPCWR